MVMNSKILPIAALLLFFSLFFLCLAKEVEGLGNCRGWTVRLRETFGNLRVSVTIFGHFRLFLATLGPKIGFPINRKIYSDLIVGLSDQVCQERQQNHTFGRCRATIHLEVRIPQQHQDPFEGPTVSILALGLLKSSAQNSRKGAGQMRFQLK